MHTGIEQTPDKSLALFISDLHLTESAPKTTEAFLQFLANDARKTKSLYILGDLFEYWAGDDDIDTAYNKTIINAIKELSNAGTTVFWVPGNRDFLTGDKFAKESMVTVLSELHTIEIANKKIALAHGDAQCLEDLDYIKFRTMVRAPQWQQQFLSLPLNQRKLMIESFRKDSQKENESKPEYIWDVTLSAVEDVFNQTGASVFIHGHTHQPNVHQHGEKLRYVLSDWDLDKNTKKAGWLEITAKGEFIQHSISS